MLHQPGKNPGKAFNFVCIDSKFSWGNADTVKWCALFWSTEYNCLKMTRIRHHMESSVSVCCKTADELGPYYRTSCDIS